MNGLTSQLDPPTNPTRAARILGRPAGLLSFFIAPMRMANARRELISSLARRRLATRYKGSVLGPLWALLVPMILLSVYVFVFGIILQAKWGMSEDEVGSYAGFAVRLFSGLLVFNLFRECLIGAPKLVRSNAVFVKRVVFPLEVLPWVILIEACVGLALGLVALFGFVLFVEGVPPPTALLIPLLIL
ncbi:MAG: ABC transporter permease, partial [Phycisphaerales bacterium]|nr:ABC transporter permease [Phycisphaerales bacterium]